MLKTFDRFLPRPRLSATAANLTAALFLVLCANTAFWQALTAKLKPASYGHWMFIFILGISLILVFNLFLSVVSFKPFHKPLMIIVLLTAAVVSYFMSSYGVIIDKQMIQNILETDTREASELLTWSLLKHTVLMGLVPVVLVIRTRVIYHPWRREILLRGGVIVVSCLLLGAGILANFKELSLFGRENKHLRMYINPTYPIYSLTKVMKKKFGTQESQPVRIVAPDALRTVHGLRRVVVLVVGETARAEEFSLNGYGRNTNPETSGKGVFNFTQVQSCGTETAVSLPCMFSHLGRENFSRSEAERYENILDVLQRTGVRVIWRDNNSGSKGVSKRITFEDLANIKEDPLCLSGECYDEILLKDLETMLNRGDGDMLVVLHQKGSHGPSYYKRSPPQFEAFTPECSTDNVQDCDRQNIINAYDNTILYTDHVLAKLIDILAAQTFPTAMLYVSDHGESLGENNIYLHGLPYMIAPSQQKHVPLLFWASKNFFHEAEIEPALLKQHQADQLSHDNLFHTLLGLFEVRSEAYRPDLDFISRAHRSGA
ncbi:phosphoethanolamine transferase [Geobacter sp. DSM 9736]|uniref:phosphoethanolamine transferase n=1 Tax=Geobacter sp. DSM 9736 TaxID=1277350 RepID=UPI000B510998|nr:phosphoethanolamine--lipid A transferase [Geobacter sp. DSM 9736]SNB47341.1 phosphatidylethanolamine:Kdo2-lipid A phosphoethanolamine transferase [Geobacter sp. DSM 9736]